MTPAARATDAMRSISCSSLLVLALSLGGCSCSLFAPRPPPVASPSPPPAPVPAPEFDVHEWGLVDVSTTGAQLVAGPPGGPTDWNAPRRKPVLYFHLAEGAAALDATVTVSVPSPGVAERFPAGELSTDARTLTWSGLHVRPEACPVTGAPTIASAACRTVDDVCEATELATYETADAACLVKDGSSFNHLFYRANGPPPPLPFEVTIQGSALSIRHVRAADVVGPILYVHNDDGAVTVATIPVPAIGQAVAPPPPTGNDIAGAQRSLDAAMREVGLTVAEIGAFDRAWASDLFGRGASRDMPGRRASPGPVDYLLFVMPASLVDGASHVVVTPPPRNLKRFLLVRVGV